jgi:hypothetical protein
VESAGVKVLRGGSLSRVGFGLQLLGHKCYSAANMLSKHAQ